MVSESEVIISIDNGVLTITLNRPKAKNAANKALAEGVSAAIDQLESDPDLRVAIVTGAGGTFCSGMDLKNFVSGETPYIDGRGFAGLTEYRAKKPIIAAVNGVAAGAGANIALACDIVVASEQASFIQAFSKIGLVPDSAGTFFLPRLKSLSL